MNRYDELKTRRSKSPFPKIGAFRLSGTKFALKVHRCVRVASVMRRIETVQEGRLAGRVVEPGFRDVESAAHSLEL